MSVMGAEKTLRRVLSGAVDAAIRFDDLCQLLESPGFGHGLHCPLHLRLQCHLRSARPGLGAELGLWND